MGISRPSLNVVLYSINPNNEQENIDVIIHKRPKKISCIYFVLKQAPVYIVK